MKTERDFGYDYAEANQGQEGFDKPVNIDEMLGSTNNIPDEDYIAMKQAGIENPSAREYWKGFNSYFD